jgi:prepilin-type N-terminal cleavage/methylation domain-containing protein
MLFFQNTKGFSLIELLITIGLTVSISLISVPLYANLQASTKLEESLAQVIDFLYFAREQSRAGLRDSAFGIYLDPGGNRIVLYQGVSYAIRDVVYDRVLYFEPGVGIATTILLNEINFAKGTGAPDTIGQIEFDFEGKKRTIEINQYGIPLEIE